LFYFVEYEKSINFHISEKVALIIYTKFFQNFGGRTTVVDFAMNLNRLTQKKVHCCSGIFLKNPLKKKAFYVITLIVVVLYIHEKGMI